MPVYSLRSCRAKIFVVCDPFLSPCNAEFADFEACFGQKIPDYYDTNRRAMDL
ncbi:hypothetical protein DSUL_100040 [Desulfovibrionales bacterium]